MLCSYCIAIALPKITELDPTTVSYFQRLPGYDTLRLVLAKKVVLVEGPSDEIIFDASIRIVSVNAQWATV